MSLSTSSVSSRRSAFRKAPSSISCSQKLSGEEGSRIKQHICGFEPSSVRGRTNSRVGCLHILIYCGRKARRRNYTTSSFSSPSLFHPPVCQTCWRTFGKHQDLAGSGVCGGAKTPFESFRLQYKPDLGFNECVKPKQ